MAKGILNIGGGVVSVDASGNFTVETGLIADGSSVFNETGVDVDFRIESDDNANMFFVDGGNDRVGIGIATPASALDVQGTAQFGSDGTDFDVTFYGDTSGRNMSWDAGTNALKIADNAQIHIGNDAAGDMYMYHDGSNSYIRNQTGALNIATADSGIAVNIGHTLSEVTINDNLSITGNITIGVDDTGGDAIFYGATASRKLHWDESADELLVHGKIS